MSDLVYYRIDSRKIGYAEYWRMVNGNPITFLIAAIAKTLFVPLDFQMAQPILKSLIPVEPREMPEDAKEAMTPMIAACRELGAELQFLYTIPMISRTTGFGAAFLSTDGVIVPQVLFSRVVNNGIRTATVTFSCVSQLPDKRLVVTSDKRKEFESPDWLDGVSMVGANVETVYKAHTARLSSMKTRPVCFTPGQLQPFVVEINNRELEARIARGIMVKMTEAEVGKLRGMLSAAPVS